MYNERKFPANYLRSAVDKQRYRLSSREHGELKTSGSNFIHYMKLAVKLHLSQNNAALIKDALFNMRQAAQR
jgi:hypothetical protein